MDKLKIEIYDSIGKVFDWDTWSYKGVDFDDVKDEIRNFEGSHIDVYINSEGGNLLIAQSIYSILKGHSATVHTHVVGYAISAATIIAMAGDKVHMADSAYFMIHNPTMGRYGDVKDMQQATTTLEVFTSKLANDYSKKTGIPLNTIRQMMDDETWMDAVEARDKGFVDVLTEGVNIAASLYNKSTFKVYNNVPKDVLNKLKNSNSKNIDMSQFAEIKNAIKEGFENLAKSFTPSENKEGVNNSVDNTAITNQLVDIQNKLIESFDNIESSIENAVKDGISNHLEGLEIEKLKGLQNLDASTLVNKEDLKKDLDTSNSNLEKIQNSITDIGKEIGKLAGQEGVFNQTGTPPAKQLNTEGAQNSGKGFYNGDTEY